METQETLKIISKAEILARAEAKFDAGFSGLMGFRFLDWEDGRVVIGMQLEPRHLNVSGHMHGGVMATLLDVAGICSGLWCPYAGRQRRAVTLTLTSTFTGQARSGQIRAIGTKRAGGSRIYNATVDILDEQDNLLMVGEGTFRLRTGSDNPYGVPIK